VPTLILAAPFPSADRVRATLDEQYANLKHKQMEIAPSGRHYLMLDRPAWLLAHLNAFLAEDE
jgi:pimeloyl-ACP methyl ester carboxylesterase